MSCHAWGTQAVATVGRGSCIRRMDILWGTIMARVACGSAPDGYICVTLWRWGPALTFAFGWLPHSHAGPRWWAGGWVGGATILADPPERGGAQHLRGGDAGEWRRRRIIVAREGGARRGLPRVRSTGQRPHTDRAVTDGRGRCGPPVWPRGGASPPPPKAVAPFRPE